VVSFHDAFPYFAAAYDIEIVGVVVDAPGQDPSAGQIAALIGEIRDAGVQVILSESQFSEDLLNTLAAETGAQVVSDLYTDTLGDPPVDTYEGAIGHDVEQIIAAMT
jgi:ABC-type Zn uptake system ZnuABC Zn-binding protein ZnuA